VELIGSCKGLAIRFWYFDKDEEDARKDEGSGAGDRSISATSD
jgi:hypothetical protein